MITWRPPTEPGLHEKLHHWKEAPLSYSHRRGIENPPSAGFIVDDHRVTLGRGQDVYQRACLALDRWQMFPAWASVAREPHTDGQPQQLGQVVAMVTRIAGLWWVNPCRVLQRCDGPAHHGFVYGTLPEHAECGEERFRVCMEADGTVWYEIKAFSRPRHLLVWLAFPLARWFQLRFVRDSRALMVQNCS